MRRAIFISVLLFCFSANGQTDNEIVDAVKKRELAEYNILVYPNPSEGNVHLNAPEGAICKVVTTKGTYVGTWEVRKEGLELEELPEGNYIVTILVDGQTVTRRFLVL